MVDGVDTPWDSTDATDEVLNLTTYGQGSIFPTTWPQNRLFFRTDTNTVYNNEGTLSTPVFVPISGMPIGSIIQFAGPIAEFPPGFFRCNGATISRTTYAALFAIIGEIYGNGDESTTFEIPDLETSNKFLSAASLDIQLNIDDGANTVSLTAAQLPSHNHDYVDTFYQSGGGTIVTGGNPNFGVGNTSSNRTTSNQGSGTAHQNRPANLKMYHLIKF